MFWSFLLVGLWFFPLFYLTFLEVSGRAWFCLKITKNNFIFCLYRLIVRNFWSHETRLPTNTLDRMLSLLSSFYSTKIETHYLSLITNFLLEMTSKSPDYSRKIFEHPLSECKFQVNCTVLSCSQLCDKFCSLM